MAKTRGKTRMSSAAKRVAIYLRVSTSEQTTTNQRRGLQAVAKRHGWSVVNVFEDAGISGAKGREGRPALDALLKAFARREVDMVAAWSVEHLKPHCPAPVKVMSLLAPASRYSWLNGRTIYDSYW